MSDTLEHAEVRRLVNDLDADLEGPLGVAVAAHLATCPECALWFAREEEAALAVPFEVPPRRTGPPVVWLVAPAIVALAAVLLFLVLRADTVVPRPDGGLQPRGGPAEGLVVIGDAQRQCAHADAGEPPCVWRPPEELRFYCAIGPRGPRWLGIVAQGGGEQRLIYPDPQDGPATHSVHLDGQLAPREVNDFRRIRDAGGQFERAELPGDRFDFVFVFSMRALSKAQIFAAARSGGDDLRVVRVPMVLE